MNTQEFKNKAHKTIDDFTDKIEKLKQKKDTTSGELNAQFNDKLASLVKQKEDLNLKYQKLKSASAENFEEMKRTFNESAEHFKTGFAKIENLLK